MTVTYMTDGSPKSWDQKKRTYEITYPLGEKVIWKDLTARECLTKYDAHNAINDYKCKLREIEGKELQLLKVKDTK